ncbi:DEAD/DEAH box helicase [Sphingomonas sp. LY54]|uniref:DEAD/DEAH box helicase n=1 Tax=Sphingomonadales TaxID=204457 RepID=UPI002ADEEAAF|nr:MULTISPECIES: DEAD/DEAH box helicase [Sphingomonadales]MEA1015029.1 DEAD/DEAH box helicase [Sphingosinicella sp. LY1275]WRP29755.1 DEAD/DEAH box helicase [Sphingomonas sp. LY54]
MSFENLGLSQPIMQALALKEYTTPSPIQEQAIPQLLQGRDLLGIAQTGTGKTAAFMLPSIDRLTASDKRPAPRTCRMLVLAPTRELASQIADSAKAYSRFSHMSVVTVFGGTSVNKNRQDVARGVDILVATPGRLMDLIEQRILSLNAVEILVLDEADQMLDLGFIHALKAIVKMLPIKRQSLFFSATMPKAIKELADKFLTDPVQVSVAPAATTAERVDQYVTFVQQAEKQALLTMMLRAGFAERGNMDRVLIFSRTKHGADRVVKLLAGNGIASNAIHGNKSQPQRERALGEFKAGKVKVLIATDIAARGIDVSGVSHVINFELPNVAEQYVHRIGRTARAGAAGVAIAYCADDEKAYLKGIERLTKQKIEVVPLPENFIAEANRIKATRVAAPAPTGGQRHDRGGEDRNRVKRPKSRKPSFGAAGAPKTNRSRRRAAAR